MHIQDQGTSGPLIPKSESPSQELIQQPIQKKVTWMGRVWTWIKALWTKITGLFYKKVTAEAAEPQKKKSLTAERVRNCDELSYSKSLKSQRVTPPTPKNTPESGSSSDESDPKIPSRKSSPSPNPTSDNATEDEKEGCERKKPISWKPWTLKEESAVHLFHVIKEIEKSTGKECMLQLFDETSVSILVLHEKKDTMQFIERPICLVEIEDMESDDEVEVPAAEVQAVS
jgi:hypothetical protein